MRAFDIDSHHNKLFGAYGIPHRTNGNQNRRRPNSKYRMPVFVTFVTNLMTKNQVKTVNVLKYLGKRR